MSSIRSYAAGALRAEMAREKKSSADLASVLGCSQSSAARRMSGDTPLDLDDIAAIARWLGVAESVFFEPTEAVAS